MSRDGEGGTGSETARRVGVVLPRGGQIITLNAHREHHLRQLFTPLHTVSIIYLELQ